MTYYSVACDPDLPGPRLCYNGGTGTVCATPACECDCHGPFTKKEVPGSR